jgi:excisionase family DNA binding protein
MARPGKVWWHSSKKAWYSTIAGKKTRIAGGDKTRDKAEAIRRDMLSNRSGQPEGRPPLTREVITAAQAAEQLGVSLATVYKLIQAGELDGYSVGRRKLVYADAIQDYRRRNAFPRATPATGGHQGQQGRSSRARGRAGGTPEGFYRHPATGELTPFRHLH